MKTRMEWNECISNIAIMKIFRSERRIWAKRNKKVNCYLLLRKNWTLSIIDRIQYIIKLKKKHFENMDESK